MNEFVGWLVGWFVHCLTSWGVIYFGSAVDAVEVLSCFEVVLYAISSTFFHFLFHCPIDHLSISSTL